MSNDFVTKPVPVSVRDPGDSAPTSTMASTTTNPVHTVDSKSDLKLDNIIYVQNIPTVPASQQADLTSKEKSINLWSAWELTRVEEQVNDKIKSGQLPNDDSVESRSKRTAYRCKVVNFYRSQSPWLTTTATATKSSTVVTTEDKLGAAIFQALQDIGLIPEAPEVSDIVKKEVMKFGTTGDMVQPHVLYITDYNDDLMQDSISAVETTFSYSVAISEVMPPVKPTTTPGKPSTKDIAKPKHKTYQALIDYFSTTANFNFQLWDQNAPKDEAPFAMGKQILQEVQVVVDN